VSVCSCANRNCFKKKQTLTIHILFTGRHDMPEHDPKNVRRAIVAAIVAIVVIGAAILVSSHMGSDKKDNRPLGPVASREVEMKVLKAIPAVDCTSIASKERLEQQLNTSLSQPHKLGGNAENGPKVVISQFCDYSPKGSRAPLAQTSYTVFTTEGLKTYRAIRAGKDDTVVSKPISGDELPSGIDDGYSFTPANRPAELSSIYRSSGIALRLGYQVVVVCFKDFSEQLPIIKWDFAYSAAQALLDKK